MPEKEFLDYISEESQDRIRCVFETRRGKVAGIKVIQYETLVGEQWMPVVRYDTAHGFFHRDVYVFRGKKHFKEFVFKPSLEEALTYAIEDIRSNWHWYKLAFMEEENGKEKS